MGCILMPKAKERCLNSQQLNVTMPSSSRPRARFHLRLRRMDAAYTFTRRWRTRVSSVRLAASGHVTSVRRCVDLPQAKEMKELYTKQVRSEVEKGHVVPERSCATPSGPGVVALRTLGSPIECVRISWMHLPHLDHSRPEHRDHWCAS